MGKVIDLFGNDVPQQVTEAPEGTWLVSGDVDGSPEAEALKAHLKEVSEMECGGKEHMEGTYVTIGVLDKNRNSIKMAVEKAADDISKTEYFKSDVNKERFIDAITNCANVLADGPLGERMFHFFQNPETGDIYVTDINMFGMVVADYFGVTPFQNPQFAKYGPSSLLAYIKSLKRENDPDDDTVYFRCSLYMAAQTTPAFDSFVSAYHSIINQHPVDMSLPSKVYHDIEKALADAKEELNGIYTFAE